MTNYNWWGIFFFILIGIGDEKWVRRNFDFDFDFDFFLIPVINMDQNQIIDIKIF